MTIVNDIILLLAETCRAGSVNFLSTVGKAARRACVMIGLLVAALTLLLGAVGLMIAALFIGLTPYLGAHWSAMIAATASLAGCGIFAAFALKMSNDQ